MITRAVPDLHPDSSKWYWLQWSQAELGEEVVITSAVWTVPAGLSEDETDRQGTSVGIRLSVAGAEIESVHDVTVKIMTNNSETLHETLRVTVSAEGH